jgi:hypothetical protein
VRTTVGLTFLTLGGKSSGDILLGKGTTMGWNFLALGGKVNGDMLLGKGSAGGLTFVILGKGSGDMVLGKGTAMGLNFGTMFLGKSRCNVKVEPDFLRLWVALGLPIGEAA